MRRVGGTRLTRDLCAQEKKPYLAIDCSVFSVDRAVMAAVAFLEEKRIHILHVAGPRASGWAAAHDIALVVIGGVLHAARRSAREMPSDIRRYIEHTFVEAQWEPVYRLVAAARLHDGSDPVSRLIRCALVAARGSPDQLKYYLDSLAVDYRDVIVAGEYDVIDRKLVRARNLEAPIE